MSLAIAAGIISISLPAAATPNCPAFSPLVEVPPEGAEQDDKTRVSADSVQLLEDGVSELQGNARITQPGRALEAEHLLIDQNKGTVDSRGTLRFQTMGVGVEAERGHYDIEGKSGEFEDAGVVMEGVGRGTAERVATDGYGRVALTRTEYTTCPPGDESWSLSARQLEIDQNTGVATGRDTVVRFKNIPFLYTPWFSFPVLVDRKSGFLIPELESSSETGLDLTTPYFFNLADNYDVTLYPRLMSERGFQLGTEFRHLGEDSETLAGVEYLPDDSSNGESRERYLFQHSNLLTENWNIGVNYNKVGDKDYFRDLDTRLERTSRTFLQRQAQTNYQAPGGWLTMEFLAQNFQTLDRELDRIDRPYERVPQLDIALRSPRYWLVQPGMEMQVTRFQRDAGIEGDRFDIRPELALEYDNQAWFARAETALRYTRYSLDNTLAIQDDNPTRTVPSYSLDTGLRFERMTGWGYLQTLTPRLYALHVPFRRQDDIPLFDTGLPDFHVDELFEENRFTGLDRIGDASQMTLAVSSELIDPATGFTPVRVTIGQIYRFDDPEIELPNTPPEQRLNGDHSDLVGALDVEWTEDLGTRFQGQYDPDDGEMNRGSVVLRYRPDEERLVNVAYRFRRGLLNQTDLSFLWPLTSRWSAVGRYNYSIRDSQNIELLAGLEYQSCCWATRVGWRRFVANEPGEFNNAIFLQLELTGLGSFGQGLERLIDRDIVGFDPVYDPL